MGGDSKFLRPTSSAIIQNILSLLSQNQNSKFFGLIKIGKVSRPTSASKEEGPKAAEYWLDETIRVLDQLQCTPEERYC